MFTAIFLSSLSLAFIRPFTTECAVDEADDPYPYGLVPDVPLEDDDDYEGLVSFNAIMPTADQYKAN